MGNKGYALVGDNDKINKLNLNGEGQITAGGLITIDTQDAWQHITNMAQGSVFNGLNFEAGDEGSITAFADAGGGQVTVTSALHGITEGDYISISGTTNYNGLYQVTNVQTNTFEITETFNGDDATGTWRHGTHVRIGAGQAGTYVYIGALSCTAASANTTFEFSFINDTTTNGISRRKFSTSTDVGSVVMLGMIEAVEGDHIAVGLRNITGSQNITINEAVFTIFKIS